MNVEVSFTADEETDSFLGAQLSVVDEAPIRPDYAIVMEGGEWETRCAAGTMGRSGWRSPSTGAPYTGPGPRTA